MMMYFRIILRYWKLAVARETQYRANFIALGAVGIVETVVTVVPMLLLFGFTEVLAGWTRGESIALVGLYRIAISLYELFAGNGVLKLSADVEQGDLDLWLIRPMNTQFLITFRYVSLFQIVNVLIGILVFVIGLSQSSMPFEWQSLLQTMVIFASGMVLLGSVVSAGAYISFRATTVEQLPWAVLDIAQMGQYPISFYPGPVRTVLSVIVPVAFVTTIPMDALRGALGWSVCGIAVGFAVLALIALRWWWNNSVKHYASASS